MKPERGFFKIELGLSLKSEENIFLNFSATFCFFLSSKHQKYEQFKIEGL